MILYYNGGILFFALGQLTIYYTSLRLICGKEYFLTSNLLCPFTNVNSCPLVILPVLILKKKILGSIYS